MATEEKPVDVLDLFATRQVIAEANVLVQRAALALRVHVGATTGTYELANAAVAQQLARSTLARVVDYETEEES